MEDSAYEGRERQRPPWLAEGLSLFSQHLCNIAEMPRGVSSLCMREACLSHPLFSIRRPLGSCFFPNAACIPPASFGNVTCYRDKQYSNMPRRIDHILVLILVALSQLCGARCFKSTYQADLLGAISHALVLGGTKCLGPLIYTRNCQDSCATPARGLALPAAG